MTVFDLVCAGKYEQARKLYQQKHHCSAAIAQAVIVKMKKAIIKGGTSK